MPNSPSGTNRRTRILIADNHTTFAETCRTTLEPEFEVVGVVLDGSKLAQSVAKLKPDIVIIDMLMPPLTGFELAARVKAARTKAKIIHMTVAADFDSAAASFRCGASAYVTKMSFPTDLCVAVRRVIRGELYLSPTIGPQSYQT